MISQTSNGCAELVIQLISSESRFYMLRTASLRRLTLTGSCVFNLSNQPNHHDLLKGFFAAYWYGDYFNQSFVVDEHQSSVSARLNPWDIFTVLVFSVSTHLADAFHFYFPKWTHFSYITLAVKEMAHKLKLYYMNTRNKFTTWQKNYSRLCSSKELTSIKQMNQPFLSLFVCITWLSRVELDLKVCSIEMLPNGAHTGPIDL